MQKVVSLSKVIGSGYNDFWCTNKRYVVVKGSRGSKKSKTTALWIIANMVKHPEANTLCVRRVMDTIRDSQFADLKWAISRLGLDAYFHCTKNPLEIIYIPTGQKILFRGLDDALKVTSISVAKGVLCWVWIEEAYEITNEDEFNKLDMSIRGETPEGIYKRIMLTFNPWSDQCWIKPRFFDTPSDNVFTKTTTWQCNEWLDESDRQLFLEMKEKNPRRYRVEGEGDWGISEGLIFDKVVIEDFDIQPLRSKTIACFGLDFGFTDPNAFTASMIDQDNKKIYIFDEWYARGVTNRIIAQQIKDMGYGGQVIICDSAEPKSIEELNDLGIMARPSRKGRDSVNHGIQLLQNYTFVIHPKCKNFIHEIGNYCWSKDRHGNITDKPDHEFSHGMDSMRYATARHLIDTFSFE